MALTGFERAQIEALRPANPKLPKVLVILFGIRIINLCCLSHKVVHGNKAVAAGCIGYFCNRPVC